MLPENSEKRTEVGHGGKRAGAGRKVGPTTDNVKMGISISKNNALWLAEQRAAGKKISWIIDRAITLWREDFSLISVPDEKL